MIYNHIPVTLGALPKIYVPPIIFQHDVKQVLDFTADGWTLPTYFVVDFLNQGDTSATPITAVGGSAEIPDELLTTGKEIIAYVVITGTDTGAVESRYDIRIKPRDRVTRGEVDPDPAEQVAIDSLIEAMNDAVGRAEGAAEEIEGMTVVAETLEPGSSASASWEDGTLTLGLPQGEKGDTGETGATPDFEIGTVTTGQAGTDASATITGTAENPVLNLTIPRGDKGDTGATGQTGPTGPTGATPSFSIGTVTTGAPGTDASASITGTDENPVLNLTIPRGNTGEVSEEDFLKVFPTDTASGSIASFSDGADDVPVKSLKLNIEPIQAGSGDPSPQNIRPISGHTGAEVVRTGKNLLHNTGTSATVRGVTFTVNNDGTIDVSGTNDGTDFSGLTICSFPTIKGETYILSGGISSSIFLRDQNAATSDTGSGATITGDGTTHTIQVRVKKDTVISRTQTVKPMFRPASDTDGTFEPYQTPTTLHRIYTDSLGNQLTVYGGVDDVTGGVVKVTKAIAEDEAGTGIAAGGCVRTAKGLWCCGFGTLSGDNVALVGGDCICDKLPFVKSYTQATVDSIASTLNGSKIAVLCLTDATSGLSASSTSAEAAAALQAWMQANPLDVVYDIATHITYSLTPADLNTLLGSNNIWNTAGDAEVEYRADVQKYIDKKLAAVVAALS